MDQLTVTDYFPQEEKFFINGSQVFGLQDINISYSYPLAKMNILGFNTRQYLQNGPVAANVSFNRIYNDKDFIFDYASGLFPVNGSLVRNINQTGQNFSFISGYLNSYGISIRNGEPITSSYNFTTYHDCGTLAFSGSLQPSYQKIVRTLNNHSVLGAAGVTAGSNLVYCDQFFVSSISTGDIFYLDDNLSNKWSGIVSSIGANNTFYANNNSPDTITGFFQKQKNPFYVPKGNIDLSLAGMEFEGINEVNISYQLNHLPIYVLSNQAPILVKPAEPINVEIGLNLTLNKQQFGYLTNIANISGINIGISGFNQRGGAIIQKEYSEMYLIEESVNATANNLINANFRYQGCIPFIRSSELGEIIIPYELVISASNLQVDYIEQLEGGIIHATNLNADYIEQLEGGIIRGTSLNVDYIEGSQAGQVTIPAMTVELVEDQSAVQTQMNAITVEVIEDQNAGQVYLNSLVVEVIEQEVI